MLRTNLSRTCGRTLLALALVTTAAAAPSDALLAEIPKELRIAARSEATTNAGDSRRRSSLVWSADGTRVAYVGERGSETMPVVGATVGDAYDRVSRPIVAGGHVIFHVANRAGEGKERHMLLIDGETLRPEDWIGEIRASPDGSRVAYWTHPGARFGSAVAAVSTEHRLAVAARRKSGSWRVARSDEYFSASWNAPTWSGDGEHVFSCAMTRKGWVVISTGRRDELVSDTYPQIDAIAVSHDGSTIAHVTRDAALENPELHVGGRRVGARYPLVARPTLDRSGARVAYVAGNGKSVTVAVGNEAAPPGEFDHIVEIAFSPDGSRVAFVAVVGGTVSESTPGLVEGGKWAVVVRRTEGEAVLERRTQHAEVRDLTWSADGSRLAYAARDARWRIVCGDIASPEHDDVGPPRFGDDGTSIEHGARVGRELWWKRMLLD